MTMGPAPIIRMLSRSVRLGIRVHQRDEPLEQIMAVLRAGAGFRMMLDREHRLADNPQAFIRIVEQRDMGWLDPGWQALGFDDKPVVLARDLDLAGQQILDRVVGAPVTAGHLGGLAAESQRQQLMPETDAENRRARGDEVTQHRNRISGSRRGVAGAVRQEDAVGPVAQHLLGGGGRRNHGYLAPMRGEHPQDVAFSPVIDRYDVMARAPLHPIAVLAVPNRLGPLITLATAYFLGEIHALETGPIEGSRPKLRDIEPPVRLMGNGAIGRSEIANAPGQPPGIDPGNADQPITF